MTIFKRPFGDYLSMAKAGCNWVALRFDPSTQNLHKLLDVFQNTLKEGFGAEAQQFIDKAKYAKMPDHVKINSIEPILKTSRITISYFT